MSKLEMLNVGLGLQGFGPLEALASRSELTTHGRLPHQETTLGSHSLQWSDHKQQAPPQTGTQIFAKAFV